jgi:hypothetical protein
MAKKTLLNQLYFQGRGVPTGPDVDKLDEQLGDLAIEQIIDYRQIETIIGFKRDETRFRTIVGIWKKRLEGRDVYLATLRNVGYQVANAEMRAEIAVSWFRQGLRKFDKVVRILDTTDIASLPEDASRAALHARNTAASFLLANRTKVKELRFSLEKDAD